MKVEKKHLTGQIANFPLHVVKYMVYEQTRQGNPADPSVFAKRKNANKYDGGFDWDKSEAGFDFWSNVTENGRFHLLPEPEKPKGRGQGHVHAELMKQYAEDAATHKNPWVLWECRSLNVSEDWCLLDSNPIWSPLVEYRRKSYTQAEPTVGDEVSPKPNEIIRAMLDKGMEVWASVSDESYDEARNQIGHYMCQIVKYDETAEYPMQTKSLGWTFAVPVDWPTMTEIVELP